MHTVTERISEITETRTGGLDPLHEAIDADKLVELTAAMEAHGWVGAPVVVYGEQALTGAHRIAAAHEADYVPVPRVEVSELCELHGIDWDELLAEHDDDWYTAAAALRTLLPREVISYLGYDVDGVLMVSEETEPHEVAAVWQALIGERDVDDDVKWWTHLVARRALLTAVSARIGDELAAIAERWHRVDGDSYATIGARVGLTRARAQQLVEQGRAGARPAR